MVSALRKNLGKKNCELGEDDIARICDTFLDFKETEQSKIFDNEAFGYWKVTVERPLRVEGTDPNYAYKAAEIKKLKEEHARSENAPPVIKKIHKKGTEADPLRGLFEATINGKPAMVGYEPDSDLRDTEQIPLQEEGGIEAFLKREVLPHADDVWYQPTASRSATRSASPATSTSRSPCGRWRRSVPTSWRWSGRPRDCWVRSSGRHTDGVRGAVMIADLKPYPAMKDSGVEWLRELPEHWNVWRSRYLFTEIDRRSKTGEETHLSMSQRLGLVPSDQVQSSLTSESYAGGKLCEPEDLVLNRLKAHLGVFALAKQGRRHQSRLFGISAEMRVGHDLLRAGPAVPGLPR